MAAPISLEEAHQWLLDFHSTSATLHTPTWLSTFLSPHAVLQYANLPPIHGRASIHSFFETVLTKLDRMDHRIESFEFIPNPETGMGKIYQAAQISYHVKGDGASAEEDREITIPGFAVFAIERDEKGGVRAYDLKTWLDPSPLMARIEVVWGEGWMGK